MPESSATPSMIKLGSAIMIGSIPFSNVVSRLSAGQDLRNVGTGTVSATGVYGVAGALPFAAACLLDVGKGAVSAILIQRCRPGLAAVAAGLSVAGHNWSPFLKGAGGRGVLPATGILLVLAPQGAALFGCAVAVGYFVGDTAPACLAAQLLLAPVLELAYGKRGAILGLAVATPMILKRMLGNGMPAGRRLQDVLVARIVYDRDAR